MRTDPEPVGLVGKPHQLLDLAGDTVTRAALGELRRAGGPLLALGGVGAVGELLVKHVMTDPGRGTCRQTGLVEFVMGMRGAHLWAPPWEGL